MLALIFLLLLANLASSKVLRTSSRWILDAENNTRVKLRCVTWPGHYEMNIPEGLQHQPVSAIAQRIADHKFNCVRLTFSIDMALNPDQLVSESFNTAATTTATPELVSTLWNASVFHNSWLETSTTRGAFAEVIRSLQAHGILVVLDNHVSRAGACCSSTDGNGWWDWDLGSRTPANSRYFKLDKWIEGLGNMASWVQTPGLELPNVVGIGLRNELRAMHGRQTSSQIEGWYRHIEQGAQAVREANRDLLVIVGGTEWGTDLGFLGDKQLNHTLFEDKLVYEFHHYAYHDSESTCAARKEAIGRKVGYLLVQAKAFTGPLFLSSFGWPQSNPTQQQMDYAGCIAEYMSDNDAEWAYMALQGSYYFKDSVANADEPYGLLNHDWSDWRNAEFPQMLGQMMEITQWPPIKEPIVVRI